MAVREQGAEVRWGEPGRRFAHPRDIYRSCENLRGFLRSTLHEIAIKQMLKHVLGYENVTDFSIRICYILKIIALIKSIWIDYETD